MEINPDYLYCKLIKRYLLNQQRWTFLDDFGGRHKVGIYHAPRSGNLMIYCNTKIVVIDFLVREPKDYSFFINDEFCEIKVEQDEQNDFSYRFNVNKGVDTPLNRLRESREKKYLTYTLIAIFLFILFLILVVYIFYK